MAPPARIDPRRVFVDSSVLVAAAISAFGSARDLVNLALDGQVELFISSLVLTESQRNIARKAPRALPIFQLIRHPLERHVIDPAPGLITVVAQTITAKDAPIIAAALAARAEYLATYDRKHLLSQAAHIQTTYNLIVATPDQILSNR